MDKKCIKTLEYNKIIDKLVGLAISPMGKDIAKDLSPITNINQINIMQQETSEAVNILLKKGSLPLGGIKDIRDSLKRSELGGTLSILELMHLGEFLYVCKKVSNYAKNERKDQVSPLLDEHFDNVTTVPVLEKEITRCILNEFEMHETASEELYRIHKSIKQAHEKIKESLNNIIHSQQYKNLLQEPVITLRNDRYCVPVKAECRQTFKGMVHDQSSTGSTVFMEPLSVVDLNNKIRELNSQKNEEIQKILTVLSEKVFEYVNELTYNIDILTKLDFIFAKGQLSIDMFGVEPIFNTNGYINIIKGRHPLINKDQVVPTDIYLGKKFTTLLITGPNTGGKTVSLKTLGLFILMGQSGLHIPAKEKSELSIFDEVFADIGDEQSIEQSLSTFSSHMTNIVKILNSLTKKSLVLLDELGAGTDPTEGAALAISILQLLHAKKTRALVTTHYSELKLYALSTEGVENAACEFDLATLRPTYKLLIGIPGKSNAFEISKKLGLSDEIIENAKEVLSHQDLRFEDVITDLEISKKTALIEKERAEQYRLEAENLKKNLNKEKEKLAIQKEKVVLKAREDATKIMLEAKNEADKLLKDYNKQLRENSHKSAESTRQTIREKLKNYQEEQGKGKKDNSHYIEPLKDVKIGDRVYIRIWEQSGIAMSTPDSSGKVMVQAGIMKMKVSLSELYEDDTPIKKPDEKPKTRYSASVKRAKSSSMKTEVDLRGMMVEEGIEKVDKFLDDAALSNLDQVTIIHGKGTGVLRNAIQLHLKKHPSVKKFRAGEFGEGDTGVTVATLK